MLNETHTNPVMSITATKGAIYIDDAPTSETLPLANFPRPTDREKLRALLIMRIDKMLGLVIPEK